MEQIEKVIKQYKLGLLTKSEAYMEIAQIAAGLWKETQSGI